MGRKRRAHLDTAVLISVLIGDRYAREMLKTLYDLARWDYEIVVTHVAVGEALAVLMRKYQNPRGIDGHIHEMIHLFRKHRIRVEDRVVSVRDESHGIAAKLHGMDAMTTGDDLAIVAQALAGPDPAVLVTADDALPNGRAACECEAELRGSRNQRMTVARGIR